MNTTAGERAAVREIKTWDARIQSGAEACDIMDAMQLEIDDLRDELEQYKIDLNEAMIDCNSYKADAEMLDWLESSATGHGFCSEGYGDYRYYAHQLEGYKTVRQVITAAMKGQQ